MTLPRAFFLAMAAGIVGVPLLSAGPELWGRLAGNPGAAAPAPDAKRTMLPDKAPPPPRDEE